MDDLLSEKEQLDQMRAWWSEYGNYVISGVVLGAGLLFGINYYQSNQRSAELEASALYGTLTEHIVDGNLDAATSVSGEIIAGFGNSAYATQSQLAMARLYMDQNRDQDAADMLNDVIAGNADDAFKQVARIRLGKILLYQNKAAEVVDLLSDQKSNAFKARFSEVLGDAYVMLGQTDKARDAYQRALAEPSQGATVDRAFVQLKLLDLPIESSEDMLEDAPMQTSDESSSEMSPEQVSDQMSDQMSDQASDNMPAERAPQAAGDAVKTALDSEEAVAGGAAE